MTFTNTTVWGADGAVYGMRAAKCSWDKSDSGMHDCDYCICGDSNKCPKAYPTKGFLNANRNGCFILGMNDLKLMSSLSKAGNDHSKFLRDIHVQVYILAPLYWWQEFDTYKIATTRLSTSLMHRAMSKPFVIGDFDFSHTTSDCKEYFKNHILTFINECRTNFMIAEDETKKDYWYDIQAMIPKNYIYGSLIDLNYQTLKTIAHSDRKYHKQDEWRVDFFNWMHTLPYAEELIFNEED